MKDWGEARTEVLSENTAQSILQRLEKQDNLREKYAQRWLWELFQNALDAADGTCLIKVEILLKDNRLTFSHNGCPFSQSQLLHLIYHGSTKVEDPDSIGQYGTGFLTTHLLSRRVRVSGALRTDQQNHEWRPFGFLLDRTGGSHAAIAEGMERSFAELRNSLGGAPQTTAPPATTFTYEITEPAACLVDESLSALERLAPYVLGFNKNLREIRVERDRVRNFAVFKRSPVGRCTLLEVSELTGPYPKTTRLLFATEKELSLAIPITKIAEEQFIIDSPGDVPRVFAAFPLFGTELLDFPFVLNCPRLEPVPERDALYLGAADEAKTRSNKKYFEQAVELYSRPVALAAEKRWRRAYNLCRMPQLAKVEWVDTEWLRSYLQKLLVVALDSALVDTHHGERAKPREVTFPRADPAIVCEFQAVLSLLSSLKVPTRDEACKWQQVVSTWEGLLTPSELAPRIVDVDGCCELVSKSGTLASLAEQLRKPAREDSKAWLNRFLEVLRTSNRLALADTRSVLPNQHGALKKRPELFRDEGIDERLKDMAALLRKDVRHELCDTGVPKEIQELLHSRRQEELVSQILRDLKSDYRLHAHLDSYQKANLDFLEWLVGNQCNDEIKQFPFLARAKDEAGHGMTVDPPMLKPLARWPETAQSYVEIFPQDRVAADFYASLDERTLGDLEELGIFHAAPVLNESRELTLDEISNLAPDGETLDEDRSHRVGPLEGVDIVYLRDDGGLADAARNSREKLMTFLRFIVHYALPETAPYLKALKVTCECGSEHSLHRAFWVGTLRDRKWVREARHRSERPTARNLAGPWNDAKLAGELPNEEVLSFLYWIGVSPGELGRHIYSGDVGDVHLYEKALMQLLNAAGHNPQKLAKAAEMLADPKAVAEFDRRRDLGERAKRNRAIGKGVEEIFQEAFTAPEISDLGLRLVREPIGSDFALEYDWSESDQEIALAVQTSNIRFLVELKATSETSCLMTRRQGETARLHKEAFALCVVPLLDHEDASLQSRSRFVVDIGTLIEDRVKDVEEMRRMRDRVTVSREDVEVIVDHGDVRYRVNSAVWERGLDFDAFLKHLLQFFRG